MVSVLTCNYEGRNVSVCIESVCDSSCCTVVRSEDSNIALEGSVISNEVSLGV